MMIQSRPSLALWPPPLPPRQQHSTTSTTNTRTPTTIITTTSSTTTIISRMAAVWAMVAILLAARIEPVTAQATGSSSTSASVFDSKYKVAEFKSPLKNITLRNIIVNIQTQDVFVGAVNHIYGLDSNLNVKVDATTGPKNDSPLCPPPGQYIDCDKPRILTNNYNKVLVIDYVHEHLISCGTLIHGFCEKRNLSDISQLDVKPDYGVPVVTNDPLTKAVAYIAPGPRPKDSVLQPNVLYVSVSWSTKTKTSPGEVIAFASRKLGDFSFSHKDFFSNSFFRVEERQLQQYPTSYVYGFSSENFSYMLNVLKISPDNNVFSSKISRVCQNDKNFYSYVEVPLECKHQGENFNILQAAYVTKAGRQLAQALGIDTKKDVLYALFSVGETSSTNPTNRNAMCVYPLEDVRKKFTDNIRRCFDGNGNTGGNHLGSSGHCNKNRQFVINDTYCGETDSNQPLAGELPMEKEAVLVFPPSTGIVTSLRVAFTYDYTVAFVGTENGHVVKVSVESEKAAHVYETVDTGLGSPIESDMPFDDIHDHLYLMTASKVLKMKVDECSQYTSCSDCLSAKDPYCGWCLLENRCSRRETCQGINLPKRWLPYNSQQCPHIKQVVPDLIQASKKWLLTLDIQNLPEFQSGYSYHCRFSSLAGADKPVASVETTAQRSNTQFQCDTPLVDQLPKFGEGEDSVRMKLSVLMNKQQVAEQVVTFFNCNVHSSCTSCTQSQFPCNWCIKNHLCTDSTERHCVYDTAIPGLNTTTNSLTQGPDYCPQFRNAKNGTEEILVAAGSKVSVQVKGESLQDFQLDSLRCQFNIDQAIIVPAKAELVQGRVYNIICDKVVFKYMRQAGFQNVPLKVLWGGGDYELDNPSDTYVVMYKCSSMADTCGDCLMVDPKYRCGWCKHSGEHCTTNMFCQGSTGNFLKQGATCLDPQILSFSPKSGPLDGGTLITITGKNLGFTQSDVFVTVGALCEIVSYTAPKEIICRTQSQAISLLDDPVPIRVGVGIGPSQHRTNAHSYTFVQPQITHIMPMIGPIDGGTSITLLGHHLDTGSELTVGIGNDNVCLNPKSLNSTSITCKTTPLASSYSSPSSPSALMSSGVAVAMAASTSSMDVITTIDNAVLQPVGVVFKYVTNPNITWMSRYSVLRR